METREVGKRLVELCNQGKNMEAIEELYSDGIVSIEAQGDEQMPKKMEGIEAIKGKNKWWEENHEVHSASAAGPFPHDDRFAVMFDIDVTPTSGPYEGNRMQMKEVGLYTVEDGKIAKEEFFYDMG